MPCEWLLQLGWLLPAPPAQLPVKNLQRVSQAAAASRSKLSRRRGLVGRMSPTAAATSQCATSRRHGLVGHMSPIPHRSTAVSTRAGEERCKLGAALGAASVGEAVEAASEAAVGRVSAVAAAAAAAAAAVAAAA